MRPTAPAVALDRARRIGCFENGGLHQRRDRGPLGQGGAHGRAKAAVDSPGLVEAHAKHRGKRLEEMSDLFQSSNPSPSLAWRIDELCDQFEEALLAGC